VVVCACENLSIEREKKEGIYANKVFFQMIASGKFFWFSLSTEERSVTISN